MISFIKGVLIEKDPTALLIDVNGIGYEVFVPMTTFYTLGDIDSQVSLYTHFVVREDAQQLYGFKSKVDKKVFQELIKVNGIELEQLLLFYLVWIQKLYYIVLKIKIMLY